MPILRPSVPPFARPIVGPNRPGRVRKALRLDGSGYCEITDASQVGLDVGSGSDLIVLTLVKIVNQHNYDRLIGKLSTTGWELCFAPNTGKLTWQVNYGSGYESVSGLKDVADNRLHQLAVFVDRLAICAFYVDGVLDVSTDISAKDGDLDTAGALRVGARTTDITHNCKGIIGRVPVLNVGYAGLDTLKTEHGFSTVADLCADIARKFYLDPYNWEKSYPELDMNEAFDTEKVTDGGIESWTGNTPDNWIETNESAGVRDITDETTTKHSGSHAAKLEATDNDGVTDFDIRQTDTLTPGKLYEVSIWYNYSVRTAGDLEIGVWANGDWLAVTRPATASGIWTNYKATFVATTASNLVILRMRDETTTGIVYFDDVSIHPVGCVADWRWDPALGIWKDATVNGNDLTPQGSGRQLVNFVYPKGHNRTAIWPWRLSDRIVPW